MMVHAARVNVKEHATNMLSQLRMMRQHCDHCDFVIKVENDEYHTHKNVMAAGSEYFRAMLAHDTKESRDGQITFKDVDSNCVKNCIDFIYSGEFEIPDGKIKDLLHIGIMLQLEGLKRVISGILAESINTENYHSTTNIADMYELHDVSSKCQRFFIENLMEIANLREFGNMVISELIDILKTDDLKYSEEEKLTILLKWAEHNPKENKALLNAIKRFKLEKMPSPFLRNLLKTHSVVSNDFMIYKLISDHLLEEKAVMVTPIHDRQNMASKSEVEEKSFDANETLSQAIVKYEQQAIATGFAPNQGRSTSSRCYERPPDLESRDSGSNIAFSKALVTLLRHKKPRSIPVDAAGYAFVKQILRSSHFRKFNLTERGVYDIAMDDGKNRFEIEGAVGANFRIRATQGHSFKIEPEAFGLRLIEDPHKYPVVVHGTYQQHLRAIKRDGLKCMKRAYIHFAIGLIGETRVTSGMRDTCDIVIVIDMPKAMRDGLKFYVSQNEAVLSDGVCGVISPKYFKAIKKYDSKSNRFEEIDFVFPA